MNRRSARKMTFTSLESLEDRLVLSTTNAFEALVDTKGGPLLGVIYAEYVNYFQGGSQGAFGSAQSHQVEMIGSTVGIDARFGAGSFAANLADMKSLGMVVTATTPSIGLVEGFMPIYQLPAVAADPNLSGLSPVLVPSAYHVPGNSPTPVLNGASAFVSLKGGPVLGDIYQEFFNYEVAGAKGTLTFSEASQVEMAGAAVGVNIRTTPANYNAMLSQMESLGMFVTATAPQVGVIEGFLPVVQLPTVASNPGLIGMSPVYRPSH